MAMMEALLRAGADPDLRNQVRTAPCCQPHQEGWTPLFSAAEAGHTAAIKLLLEHGSIVNDCDAVSRRTCTIAAGR